MSSITPIPQSTLDALFPAPPNDPLLYYSVPGRLPGQTKESTETLIKYLKENHDKWHIFFNDRGFHNHTTHHLYAIYAMGATPGVIEAAYKSNAVYQRDAFESPEEITEANWMQHFDDEKYYRGYLKFFNKSVLEIGSIATLEKYVFAPGANFIDSIGDDKKQPQMLNRFLSGVLHPYIHAGYALEFNAPGMMSEGLAMACVQPGTDIDPLVPRSYFTTDSITSRLASALNLGSTKSSGTHSFSILAQMAKDPDLSEAALQLNPKNPIPITETLQKQGEKIKQYAEKWEINPNDKQEVKAKLEELAYFVTILYGVTGMQGKQFLANFFSMHLVTSYLFLPAFVAQLSPSSTGLLLRAYFASALTVWVAGRRPPISVKNFYANSPDSFTFPGPQPTPDSSSLAAASASDGVHPNPWMSLLLSTIVHPDEHLPKIQRALAHFSREYGTIEKGYFKGTELEGAEELDGTIFIRVAWLTMGRLGWVREGEPKGHWDRVSGQEFIDVSMAAKRAL